MSWMRPRVGPEFVFERHFPEQHQEAMSTLREFEQVVVPFAVGTVAVAAPYVVGASLVYFGPTPYHKVLGASMLVPGPQDALYFALGYGVGKWWVDDHSIFGDEWV